LLSGRSGRACCVSTIVVSLQWIYWESRIVFVTQVLFYCEVDF